MYTFNKITRLCFARVYIRLWPRPSTSPWRPSREVQSSASLLPSRDEENFGSRLPVSIKGAGPATRPLWLVNYPTVDRPSSPSAALPGRPRAWGPERRL